MTSVVIVGSGGREHALALALADEAEVVRVTPGNAGIPGSCDAHPCDLAADLFIIGPEAPLVRGLADQLRAEGKLVFGPGRDGARLEGSKVWMKEVLDEATVPTARWKAVQTPKEALEHLIETASSPYVIKTDGLASGHGVLVTSSLEEAIYDADKKLSGESFGAAGHTIVMEEGLCGRELSVTAICNGTEAILLPFSRDYKRLLDGDKGPNTGGMGAFSPVPDTPDEDYVLEIVKRILGVMRKRGIDYRGVLYVGLMLTPEGPKVLECNVRFGDPEAQVVLPRISSGLLECLTQAAAGEPITPPAISSQAAVTVTLASEGYPGSPIADRPISIRVGAERVVHVPILHGGTARDADGELITAGGRVMYVTGLAHNALWASAEAYSNIEYISWEGMQYRTDIGER